MRLKPAILIVLACALSAHGRQRNDWYEPCLLVAPGVTELGDMPRHPLRVDAHVRVKQPAPYTQSTVALAWNFSDTLNYAYARLDLTGHADDIYLGKTILTLGTVADGIDAPSQQIAFDPGVGYESVRLIYDGFSARIATAAGTYPVRYDADGPTRIMMLADSPVHCRRLTAMGHAAPPLAMLDAESVDSIYAAISASSDNMQGVWEYMDRDMRPGSSTLGGQYRLATIKSADGGYDIVYLDGAEANSGLWKPLTLKGHLSPTIFTGNCDLTWIDANGQTVQRECNAQLDPNGAILTLRFPLQGAQIRFRRVIL